MPRKKGDVGVSNSDLHVNKKGELVHDKRKTVSSANSVKSLKFAKNIAAECNNCIYRSIEDGGNGKCPKYEKDAACAIRKDIAKFLSQIDTRKADDLKNFLDFLMKQSGENIMMAFAQAKMDGNIPDRNTRSELNTFLQIVKVMNEMTDKVEATETRELSPTGDIQRIFKQLRSVRNNKENDDNAEDSY